MKEIFNTEIDLVVFGPEELAEYKSKGKANTVMDFNPQFTLDVYKRQRPVKIDCSVFAVGFFCSRPGYRSGHFFLYDPHPCFYLFNLV